MKTFIYLLFLVLLLQGCKQEIVVENDLPFIEKLVIKGMLSAGKAVKVNLSKTVQISGTLNENDFLVKDAKAYVKNHGINYELVYDDSGYYSTKDLIASNGEKYELNVDWKEKSSSSMTTVPNSTQYQNAKLITEINGTDTTYFLQCLLTPRTGAVYGVTWVILNGDSAFRMEDDVIPELKREEDKNLLNLLILKTRNIPVEFVNKWKHSLYIRVFAFDSQYYNFFLTQHANSTTTNIFNQGNINLRWNIQGDAIGMFIGQTDFIIKVNIY